MHEMQIAWKDGYELEACDAFGHTVRMDLAEEAGGADAGFRPMHLILTALGGCMGVDVRLILAKKKLPLRSLEVRVTGQLTDTVPRTYAQIETVITAEADGLTQEQLDEAIRLAEEKYCNVSAILRSSATLVAKGIVK